MEDDVSKIDEQAREDAVERYKLTKKGWAEDVGIIATNAVMGGIDDFLRNEKKDGDSTADAMMGEILKDLQRQIDDILDVLNEHLRELEERMAENRRTHQALVQRMQDIQEVLDDFDYGGEFDFEKANKLIEATGHKKPQTDDIQDYVLLLQLCRSQTSDQMDDLDVTYEMDKTSHEATHNRIETILEQAKTSRNDPEALQSIVNESVKSDAYAAARRAQGTETERELVLANRNAFENANEGSSSSYNSYSLDF